MTTETKTRVNLTAAEKAYLNLGLKQPGGKLPIFDYSGQTIPQSIIKKCIEKGMVERWFANPMKPDWLVCKLTDEGRRAIG